MNTINLLTNYFARCKAVIQEREERLRLNQIR